MCVMNIELCSKQIDFGRIQKQYLEALQLTSQQQALKLEVLRAKVHRSATLIQKFWKRKRILFKNKCSSQIQVWWRSMRNRLAIQKRILSNFKTTFYKGVFIEITRKFVLQKLKRTSLKKGIHTKSFNGAKMIIGVLKANVVYLNSVRSQIGYMSNLKLYNQLKFRKEWERYQKELREFIKGYIKKKWIKERGVYLDEKGKQRNKEEFIQKQVEKLYDDKFDKLQATQLTIAKGIAYLKDVEIGMSRRGSCQMLRMVTFMINKL